MSADSKRFKTICLGISVITLALYLPSLWHEFLIYDDQQYVTGNPHVRAGLTWAGIRWAFTTFYASNWHPLTWLSHMLDCQFYHLHPAGHHLTNVLLHVANSVLLLTVLHRMTGALWRSACVAALFAWHPLHVESVAWLAERKDVLSAFFFMLTIWAYVWYAEGKGFRVHPPASIAPWGTEGSGLCVQSSRFKVQGSRFGVNAYYLLALLFFALGLMSKPMLVTLPFVLLLLDWWPLGRLSFKAQNPKRLLEKLPFLALSAGCCVMTILAQQKSFAVVSTAGLPLARRLSHAVVSYSHYLAALVLPRHLAVYYPYPHGESLAGILNAGLVLALMSVLVWRTAARRPYLAAGWLWYLGTLVPVIGLMQVGDQAWADRYTYIPSIGIFLIVIWSVADLALGWGPVFKFNQTSLNPLLCGASLLLGLVLLFVTSLQLQHWKTTQTLFEHAAGVTQNNSRALAILGSLLAEKGQRSEALDYYSRALRMNPNQPETHFCRGNVLEQQGKLEEAVSEYQQALRFKPIQAQTHVCLGVLLAKHHNYPEAAKHYQAALELNPESATAHNNLGRLLQTQGRLDEAIEHYIASVQFDPNLAPTRNNLGVALLQKGRLAEGTTQLREALRLARADPGTEFNLASALNNQGQWTEASELLTKAIASGMNSPEAHYQLGLSLEHLGKTREAMGQYASALLLRQDYPETLNQLSWILATSPNSAFRNATESLRMAHKACELTGRKDAAKLKTLAAALAEAGRFQDAAATAQAAMDLAATANGKELAEECGRMLAMFQAGKPWRQSE